VTRDLWNRGATALCWIFLVATAASAAYPERPVRYIVPSAPGGSPDITARVLTAELTQRTGRQFVVDNRDGASGIIGTQMIAKAAPDGYTIGQGLVPAMAVMRSEQCHWRQEPSFGQ